MGISASTGIETVFLVKIFNVVEEKAESGLKAEAKEVGATVKVVFLLAREAECLGQALRVADHLHHKGAASCLVTTPEEWPKACPNPSAPPLQTTHCSQGASTSRISVTGVSRGWRHHPGDHYGGQRLTIRLACIDAPEMAQGAMGQAARVALAGMVQSGALEIRPQTTDKYGRTVAEVFVGDRNVNLELVRYGHAFAYRKYLAQCDQAAYLGAEAWAQQYGQGVWRYGTERPWDYRQRRRESR
jgi:endonuclease YncB( thermonuclease family)